MSEMILPGTYVEVRAEGLISAGRVSTGNIGIVGTAEKGEVDRVTLISSFAEAKAIFGESDDWVGGTNNELTLIRALDLVYRNGGRTVYAIRTARHGNQQFAKASYEVKENTTTLLTLEAKTPGTWGNGIHIKIDAPSGKTKVELTCQGKDSESYEITDANDLDQQIQSKSKLVTASTPTNANNAKIPSPGVDASFSGGQDTDTATSASYTVKIAKAELLTLTAKTPGRWGNDIHIKITAPITPRDPAKVELTYGVVEERYQIDSVSALSEQINAGSKLVTASSPDEANTNKKPSAVIDAQFENGNNGAAATSDDYQKSLALLEDQEVNIVLLAGQGVGEGDNGKAMVGVLEGHLKATAAIKRERIGIIGSGTDDLETIAGHSLNNDRLIFVAPGAIVTSKGKQNQLPGGYLAAAVAGLISSLPVQTSPTNKVLAIEGLSTTFNIAKLERLTQNRVLVVEKRNGFRIVKGITTNNEAWSQITTRRIVDYAIYGVRSACDPYIGKLNNARVRGAMKATLDGFLTRMVEDEALVSYQLEVSATRAQEIAGETQVIMTLMPTFSIDFIKVTMYLN
jgi:hypothetical protein